MDSIVISNEKILQLRKFFDKAYYNLEDAQWVNNKEQLEKLYNIKNVERKMQTKRGLVKGDARDLVIECCANFNIDENIITNAHMNFARAFLPIAIHVDIADPKNDGDTIIIPLTFDTKIKTIWWKGKITSPIFDDWINAQDWSTKKRVNKLSEEFDLSNGYWSKPEIIDYMDLDGIGEWQRGNVFRGRRSQPHCSTNFLNSGIKSKDYILIQTSYPAKENK
jgi:hypothetical protein